MVGAPSSRSKGRMGGSRRSRCARSGGEGSLAGVSCGWNEAVLRQPRNAHRSCTRSLPRVHLKKTVRTHVLRVDPTTKVPITELLFTNPQGMHLRFISRLTFAPPLPLTATCFAVDATFPAWRIWAVRLAVRSCQRSPDPPCEGFATHLVGRGSELGLSCTKVPLSALSSPTPPALPHRGQGSVCP